MKLLLALDNWLPSLLLTAHIMSQLERDFENKPLRDIHSNQTRESLVKEVRKSRESPAGSIFLSFP